MIRLSLRNAAIGFLGFAVALIACNAAPQPPGLASCELGLCQPPTCSAENTDVSITASIARAQPAWRSAVRITRSSTTTMRECAASYQATDARLHDDHCTESLSGSGTVTLRPHVANGERFVAWRADPEIGQCPMKCLATAGECVLAQEDLAGLDLSEPIYCVADFGPGQPSGCGFRRPPEDGPIWVHLPDAIRVTISGYGGSTPQCAALNGTHIARLSAEPYPESFDLPECSWRTTVVRGGLPYTELIVVPLAPTASTFPLVTELALSVVLQADDHGITWPSEIVFPPSFPLRAGERFDFAQFLGYTLTANGVAQASYEQSWDAARPCVFVRETSQVQLDFDVR